MDVGVSGLKIRVNKGGGTPWGSCCWSTKATSPRVVVADTSSQINFVSVSGCFEFGAQFQHALLQAEDFDVFFATLLTNQVDSSGVTV
jgi:hypothetical protein